ncbi:tetratricopeptide repeat protein [Colwellia echini]|uniref:Tetratricopeptide repeat protein n=1 Tax=Colwellia echini TaxID=1982103 RepID=A0ABY3MVA4_9GAMM|nr:tetratricopeptide repeat protein [Colwellia echini]TYK64987.1 tetratricopeptide repeat protein [Colwellia echini]
MPYLPYIFTKAPALTLALLIASSCISTNVLASNSTTEQHKNANTEFNTNIKVVLQQPQWQFLLQNQPLEQTEARIAPNESGFAKRIQPLLDKQDYNTVMQAFAERDLKQDSAALCQLRGQIQLILKDYQGAEQSLQQALTLSPSLALAHRSLSMVYMVNKSYKKAQYHLQQSIQLGAEDAQVLGQLAFVNLQLGQAASAVSGYQRALFLAPEDKQWQQGLLYALLNSHAFDQAQALLEEMLQNDMNNSELWLHRGQLALKQNRLAQAITSLEIALILGNNDVENLATAAKLHIQAGSPNRAVEILVDNLPIFFGQISAQNTAKTSTKVTSKATSKSTATSQTVKLDIDTVDQISAWLASQQNWNTLALLLDAVDKSTQVSQQNQNARPLPAKYQARFDVYHAQMDIANNNLSSAQKRLTSALNSDPTHGEALLSLATLLNSQNRDEQALQYFIRAQALTNYKERALLGHAQLEIDRQNYAQAITLLQQVMQINPARHDVLANIKTLKSIEQNNI